jgi:hypothetical protein
LEDGHKSSRLAGSATNLFTNLSRQSAGRMARTKSPAINVFSYETHQPFSKYKIVLADNSLTFSMRSGETKRQERLKFTK